MHTLAGGLRIDIKHKHYVFVLCTFAYKFISNPVGDHVARCTQQKKAKQEIKVTFRLAIHLAL